MAMAEGAIWKRERDRRYRVREKRMAIEIDLQRITQYSGVILVLNNIT